MNDLNMFMCIGRLTRDPDLKYTASGKAVVKFGIAVNKSYRKTDGEVVNTPLFVNVTAWNKVAENVANFLSKGSKVAINGSLQSNNWEDKDGNRKTSFEIMAFNVQFLDNKPKRQNDDEDEPLPEEVEEMVEHISSQTEVPF